MSKVSIVVALVFGVLALALAVVGTASANTGWFSASGEGGSVHIGTLKGCVNLLGYKICGKLNSSIGAAGKAAFALLIISIVALIAAAICNIMRLFNQGGKILLLLGGLLSLLVFAAMASAWTAYLGVVFSKAGENKPDVDYALPLTAIGSGFALVAAVASFIGFRSHQDHHCETKPLMGYGKV